MNGLAQLLGVRLIHVEWIGVNCWDNDDVLFAMTRGFACKLADAWSDAKHQDGSGFASIICPKTYGHVLSRLRWFFIERAAAGDDGLVGGFVKEPIVSGLAKNAALRADFSIMLPSVGPVISDAFRRRMASCN